MKEYLYKLPSGTYQYTETNGVPEDDWYEIPEGSDFASIDSGGLNMMFFPQEGCLNDPEKQKIEGFKIIWEREKERVNPVNHNEFNPLVPQEGGDHYKLRPIQPIEYSERNGLSMSQGNIVKYITRHKEKNGVEDLAKVVHYALLEAYFVYDVKGSTELKQRILKMLGD